MEFIDRRLQALFFALILVLVLPWPVAGEDSGRVHRVTNTKTDPPPTMNRGHHKRQPRYQDFAATKDKGKGPGEDKGNPGPLPCKSKNNPKCEPESPSKYQTGDL